MTRGQHRDAFAIEAPNGPRFEVALERFVAGHSFEFRDVAFRIADNGVVSCVVDSSWHSSNVTAETATEDFTMAEQVFHDLASSSAAFASAVRGRPIHYLLIEDYGTGGVVICSRIDGDLVWAPGFPERNP